MSSIAIFAGAVRLASIIVLCMPLLARQSLRGEVCTTTPGTTVLTTIDLADNRAAELP